MSAREDADTDEPVRIFILEDDSALGETMRRALAEHFVVHLAADMEETQALFAEHRYDVVISDLFIKAREGDGRGQGGVTLIGALRSGLLDFPDWGRTVPIVAITGASAYNGFDPLAVAANVGATAVLRKPFSSVELTEAVVEQLRPERSARWD